MDFTTIARTRQSCRKYDPQREVEDEKLQAILESACLAPSGCNSQPYHITVCRGESAKQVATAVMEMGINQFATDAPVIIVISEGTFVPIAALADKIKKGDYRPLDIGILAAYITAEATAQGLGTCILGVFNSEKIRTICGLQKPVRLVITLGYAPEGYPLRKKQRKPLSDLVTIQESSNTP